MKSSLLTFAILLLSLAVYAIDKNKPVNLTGSWKEQSRMSPDGKTLAYTDTTYYDFLVGNEYTVQHRGSYMYRGTYKTTPGTIDLGMRMYSVLEWSPNKII